MLTFSQVGGRKGWQENVKITLSVAMGAWTPPFTSILIIYCTVIILYIHYCLTASLVWLCKCKSWKLLIPGCLTLPLGYIIFFTLFNLRFSIANLYLTITSSIFRHLEKVSWYLAKLLYFPYHGSNIFPLCHWK